MRKSRKKILGKSMAHWERMAKKLVVEQLVHASFVDTRSIPGKIASDRLIALARAEDPTLFDEVLKEREGLAYGVARVLAEVTG
jgi:hypothetical protein